MGKPFVVYSLSRSRTAWLSRFLTYGDWVCGHDELRHMRNLEDVLSWFRQPCIGTVETAAAPYWRLAQKMIPGAKVVVVRRPVDDVIDSLLKLYIPSDKDALVRQIRYQDGKLQQIEKRVPGTLSVSFDDLNQEDVCASVFEHCLGISHDAAWWRNLATINIQIDFRALLRYVAAHQPQLHKLAAQAKHQMLSDLHSTPIAETDGVTIQTEPFDTFYRDGQELFREHLMRIDEDPYTASVKNIDLARKIDAMDRLQIVTARCNGRMFGYLMSVIGPSLESEDITTGLHLPFYASPSIPGLGIKLQRASIEYLRQRGATEVLWRSGIRGDGDRMGALYSRLGAEYYGKMYRLELKRAS